MKIRNCARKLEQICFIWLVVAHTNNMGWWLCNIHIGNIMYFEMLKKSTYNFKIIFFYIEVFQNEMNFPIIVYTFSIIIKVQKTVLNENLMQIWWYSFMQESKVPRIIVPTIHQRKWFKRHEWQQFKHFVLFQNFFTLKYYF